MARIKSATKAPPAPVKTTHTGGVQGQEVSIGLDTRPVQSKLPTIPAGSPWLYRHHPNRWDVLGDKVRPVLGRLKYVPGVNNVGRDGNVTVAALESGNRGWTVIPNDVDGQTYLRKYEVNGGHAFLSRWETCFPGTDKVRTDTDGYYDWLDGLRSRGNIEPPSLEALNALERRYQSYADRSRNDGTSASARNAETYDRRLRTIRAEIDAILSSAPAAQAEEVDLGGEV